MYPHEWRRQLRTARRRASDANSQKESRFVTEREGCDAGGARIAVATGGCAGEGLLGGERGARPTCILASSPMGPPSLSVMWRSVASVRRARSRRVAMRAGACDAARSTEGRMEQMQEMVGGGRGGEAGLREGRGGRGGREATSEVKARPVLNSEVQHRISVLLLTRRAAPGERRRVGGGEA